MRRFVFFIALFVVQCFAQGQWTLTKSVWNRLEFSTIGGVPVDPCHIGLSDASPNHDCIFNELPDPSHTIIVPTLTSFLGTGKVLGTNPSTSVTVTGHYLRKGTGQTLTFALSSIAGRCSAIDPTLQQITIDATSTDTQITFTAPVATVGVSPGWFGTAMEFEVKPRSLCFGFGAAGAVPEWFYTGAKWKVSWVTPTATNCPPPISSVPTDASGVTRLTATDATYIGWPMNATYILQRQAMTSSCSVQGNIGGGYYQCFNPNVMSCCSNSFLMNKYNQKCCPSSPPLVQWRDAACLCTYSGDCPTTESTCCLPSKYPELTTTTNKPLGQCYNSSVHACCDTGRRYDTGADQCCKINGVQSLDIPCPCNTQSDCVDPTKTSDSTVACCLQYSPAPWESALYPGSVCSKYANFPTGTGLYNVQPCLGSCIRTNFQICCNGVACMQNVEYCCNSTCCNKYVGTCHSGYRAGSPGNWNNNNDFGITFLQCTTIEQLNTIKSFWIFVLPTELMFASFFGLAVCLSFAAKASEGRRYSILEVVMLGAAILSILFAITHFFAPIYKYGVVVVVVSLLAIITSAVREKWLTLMCVVFQLVAVFYLFDFIDGNYYLELNSNRNFTTGLTDPMTMGVLHSIQKMWPSPDKVQSYWVGTPVAGFWQPAWCTTYYNYFQWDPQLHDTQRVENPQVTTFGYCSRAWATALYLFTAAIMDLVILQLIVDILALIVRFQATSYVPIALETGKQVA